jgi:hypothetical protein
MPGDETGAGGCVSGTCSVDSGSNYPGEVSFHELANMIADTGCFEDSFEARDKNFGVTGFVGKF